MLLTGDFFEITEPGYEDLFRAAEPVWTVLDRIPAFVEAWLSASRPLAGHSGLVTRPLVIVDGAVREDLKVEHSGPGGGVRVYDGDLLVLDAAVILPGAYLYGDDIVIGARTLVEPGALIKGPTVLGSDTEVRQGAYLRGNCVVGNRCVVGHATEIKNSIMLDDAKAGHFAYIGDSILGRHVNLGAGTKLANLKMIHGTITFAIDGERYDTGRRKLGAILGDRTETGCNSVTAPGTLMRPGSIVYAGISVPGGYYPPKSYLRLSRGVLNIKLGKSAPGGAG
jgi:acetyltransferase-like isoleucine patch superfamily enzyme